MRANFTLEDHQQHTTNAKLRGGTIITTLTPCCQQPITTTAPNNNESWWAILMCPHCGTVHETTTTKDSVTFTLAKPPRATRRWEP